jgi:hypothetical protein
VLIERGVIKLYNPKDQNMISNKKPQIWARNKNVTNDKFIDTKVVGNIQPSYATQNTVQEVQSYVTNTKPNNQITYYQNKKTTNPQNNQTQNDQGRMQQ